MARPLATPQPPASHSAPLFRCGEESNEERVITGERGVIPDCIPVGSDNHMAVDSLGHPWPEAAKLPSTVDAWLGELAKKSGGRQSVHGSEP